MSRLLRLVVAAFVPVILTALNVHLLATPTYLRLVYALPGFPEAPGFTAESRLAAATASTVFIVRTEPPAVLAALQHDGAPLYTPGEIGHIVDVRRLVGAVSGAGIAGLVVLLGAAIWRLAAGDRAWIGRAVGDGSRLTLVLVALVALGVLAAWPVVFVAFHELLFPPGTWQFAEDSSLIRLFPEVFWQDAAIALVAMTVAEGLVLARVGQRLRPRGSGTED